MFPATISSRKQHNTRISLKNLNVKVVSSWEKMNQHFGKIGVFVLNISKRVVMQKYRSIKLLFTTTISLSATFLTQLSNYNFTTLWIECRVLRLCLELKISVWHYTHGYYIQKPSYIDTQHIDKAYMKRPFTQY